jgi:hypothetical protein
MYFMEMLKSHLERKIDRPFTINVVDDVDGLGNGSGQLLEVSIPLAGVSEDDAKRLRMSIVDGASEMGFDVVSVRMNDTLTVRTEDVPLPF